MIGEAMESSAAQRGPLVEAELMRQRAELVHSPGRGRGGRAAAARGPRAGARAGARALELRAGLSMAAPVPRTPPREPRLKTLHDDLADEVDDVPAGGATEATAPPAKR